MTAVAVTQQPKQLDMSEQERFFRYFQTEVVALQDRMQLIEDHGTSGGERADAIDHCLAGISKLSNDVKDISGSLPAHDQRTYSEAIKALSEKLQKTRAQATPKPKFSFKSGFPKKNASAISINDAAELAAKRRLQPSTASSTTSSFATTPLTVPQTPADENASQLGEKTNNPNPPRKALTITNHSKEHIMHSSSPNAESSATISNIRRSVVQLTGSVATLTLKNIKDSLIVCGHVSGAIHITSVKDSVLVVSTRQFRMHESTNVKVYLHCGSRPIIEDCNDVKFTPLPETYITEQDERVKNLFDQVDDFKWLKAEHSPNWGVLGEEQRVKEEVWKNAVPGGPNLGVGDILKAVGL